MYTYIYICVCVLHCVYVYVYIYLLYGVVYIPIFFGCLSLSDYKPRHLKSSIHMTPLWYLWGHRVICGIYGCFHSHGGSPQWLVDNRKSNWNVSFRATPLNSGNLHIYFRVSPVSPGTKKGMVASQDFSIAKIELKPGNDPMTWKIHWNFREKQKAKSSWAWNTFMDVSKQKMMCLEYLMCSYFVEHMAISAEYASIFYQWRTTGIYDVFGQKIQSCLYKKQC